MKNTYKHKVNKLIKNGKFKQVRVNSLVNSYNFYLKNSQFTEYKKDSYLIVLNNNKLTIFIQR